MNQSIFIHMRFYFNPKNVLFFLDNSYSLTLLWTAHDVFSVNPIHLLFRKLLRLYAHVVSLLFLTDIETEEDLFRSHSECVEDLAKYKVGIFLMDRSNMWMPLKVFESAYTRIYYSKCNYCVVEMSQRKYSSGKCLRVDILWCYVIVKSYHQTTRVFRFTYFFKNLNFNLLFAYVLSVHTFI